MKRLSKITTICTASLGALEVFPKNIVPCREWSATRVNRPVEVPILGEKCKASLRDKVCVDQDQAPAEVYLTGIQPDLSGKSNRTVGRHDST